jgi:hypothetical protein
MKNFYLLALLFIACAGARAQKVSYIFTAGFNEFKAGNGGMYPHDHFVSGYNFGSLFDIRWGNISLQPGWLIKSKGGTSKDVHYSYVDPALTGFVSGVNSERTRLDYIEVPVNVIFWIKAPKGEFFVGGGPYGAVGLNTHESMDNQSENIYFRLPHFDFSKNNGLKRFDYGLNTLAGYKLENGLGLNVGYSYGLINISDYSEYTKNRGFNISVSYTLGVHKKG